MIDWLALGSAVTVLIALEAFFSGSEIAFVSANRARLLRLAKEDRPDARMAKSLISRPEQLFATTVLGTSLAMSATSVVCTLFLTARLGSYGEWANFLALTPLVLLFGEFLPKAICRKHADQIVLRLGKALKICGIALYPATRLLAAYTSFLNRILGVPQARSFLFSREEIKGALPASRGSDITASERELLFRILEFRKRTAKDMLRPLIDVVAIEEANSIGEAVKRFNESGHSRIPVYRDRVDNIVGLVSIFDCLRAPALEAPVAEIMQPPLFIPDSKPVGELLEELRNLPMAVAVDEYGGAKGILTREDVIEEIVGEIEDEYDEPPRLYHQISENAYVVNARMEIKEIRQQLEIPIPEGEDYQTLGGFLLKRMQKIPRKWESTVVDGVEYVVQVATDRSIEEVYVVIHRRPG